MIFGEYPCCGGAFTSPMPDTTPVFEREDCPWCGEVVWHKFSRIESLSWTEENFLKFYKVDQENFRVVERTEDGKPMWLKNAG